VILPPLLNRILIFTTCQAIRAAGPFHTASEAINDKAVDVVSAIISFGVRPLKMILAYSVVSAYQ
jgi:hypothetical protein